jgi:HEAT repeat protein
MSHPLEGKIKRLVEELDTRASLQARKELQAIDRDVVLKVVESLLSNDSSDLRANAAEALLRLDPYENLPKVLVLLDDVDETVRWFVCGLLHDFGDTRAAPRLSKALAEDSSALVRLTATYALAKMGDRMSLPALRKAVEFDRGQDYEGRTVKDAAAEAINEINRRLGSPRS